MNPNIRSLISYNTDTEYTASFRFNGVLLAEAAPTGGLISGSSSVMEMEGWNWEDAAHSVDIGHAAGPLAQLVVERLLDQQGHPEEEERDHRGDDRCDREREVSAETGPHLAQRVAQA